MADQPQFTDMIPKRLGTYWGFFIFSLLLIVGLEYLFLNMEKLGNYCGIQRIEAFDLNAKGNLALWFISVLWFYAALVSSMNFQISKQTPARRKYADIWIWGALSTGYLSLDTIANIRDVFRDLMIHITGTRIYGDGSIWWIGLYAILFGMVGTRLLAEMRHYLPSCNSFLMTGICYISAICVGLGLINVEAVNKKWIVDPIMVKSGLEMLGNVFIVMAFTLYARHLILIDPTTFSKWYSGLWRTPGIVKEPPVKSKPVKPKKAILENSRETQIPVTAWLSDDDTYTVKSFDDFAPNQDNPSDTSKRSA